MSRYWIAVMMWVCVWSMAAQAQQVTAVRTGEDTWLDAANPHQKHGNEAVLQVGGSRWQLLRHGSRTPAEDALMSDMMEIGAHESVLQEGRRIKLSLEGDMESDAIERERQRKQFGCDPLDVEAMLAVSFPRP
jgi:hypothetical protein